MSHPEGEHASYDEGLSREGRDYLFAYDAALDGASHERAARRARGREQRQGEMRIASWDGAVTCCVAPPSVRHTALEVLDARA